MSGHQNDHQTTGLFDGKIRPGVAFAARFFHTRFEIPLYRWVVWNSLELITERGLPAYGLPEEIMGKMQRKDVAAGGVLLRTEHGFPLPAFGEVRQVIQGVHSLEDLLKAAAYPADVAEAADFLAHGCMFNGRTGEWYHRWPKDVL